MLIINSFIFIILVRYKSSLPTLQELVRIVFHVKSLTYPSLLDGRPLYNSVSRLLKVCPKLIETLDYLAINEHNATALGYFLQLCTLEQLSVLCFFDNICCLFIN